MEQRYTETDAKPIDARQIRVRPDELTKAIAILEQRKAPGNAESDDKFLIGEALRHLGIEQSPETVWQEVLRIRQQEKAARAAQARRKRRRILCQAATAAVVAAITAGSVISQTVYNPKWQAKRQQQAFRQMLSQTLGSHPQYYLIVAPDASLLHNLYWQNPTTYPVAEVPDGFTIHAGSEAPSPFFAEDLTAANPSYRVMFVGSQKMTYYQDCEYTYYHGAAYYRGWLPRQQIPLLLKHQPVVFIHDVQISPAVERQVGTKDFVPLTIPCESVEQQHGYNGQIQELSWLSWFPKGQNLAANQHLWDQPKAI